MDRTDTHLKAKIAARNYAGKTGNEVYKTLIEIFRPLVGTKVLKVDGDFLAKVQALIPDLPYVRGASSIQVFRHHSDYSLAWTCKACESVPPHGCVYEDTTVYIGRLDGQVLSSLEDAPNFRHDYDFDTVKALRKDAEEKKQVYEAARSACFPFGEG